MEKFDSLKYKPIVITFDGTSASGKGTLVKGLINNLDERYKTMDAGAMYRALTFYCIMEKIGRDDILNNSNEILRNLSLESLIQGGVRLNGELVDDLDLRTSQIGSNVSQYADISEVKEFIVGVQREFVEKNRNEYGLILDGRCMGTAVAPKAEIKFYTDSPIWARAAWRQRDFTNSGDDNHSVESVKIALEKRDREDMETKTFPLLRPSDAYDMDTSKFAPKEGVNHVFARVRDYLINS